MHMAKMLTEEGESSDLAEALTDDPPQMHTTKMIHTEGGSRGFERAQNSDTGLVVPITTLPKGGYPTGSAYPGAEPLSQGGYPQDPPPAYTPQVTFLHGLILFPSLTVLSCFFGACASKWTCLYSNIGACACNLFFSSVSNASKESILSPLQTHSSKEMEKVKLGNGES